MTDKEELKSRYEEIKEKGSHLDNIKNLNLSVDIFSGDNFISFLEETIFNGKKIKDDEKYILLKAKFNEFLSIVYQEKILNKRELSQAELQDMELFLSHTINLFSILEGAINLEKKGKKYLAYWITLNLYLNLYEITNKYLDETIEDLGNFASDYNQDIKEKVDKRFKLSLYDFLVSVGEVDKIKSKDFKKIFENYIDYELRNKIAHLSYIIKENSVLIGKGNNIKDCDISYFVSKTYSLILFLFVIIGSDYGILAKLKSKIKSSPEAKKHIKKVFKEFNK